MAHTFAMVEAAFQALNTPEPTTAYDPDGHFIPLKGRRQFVSDLKAGQ